MDRAMEPVGSTAEVHKPITARYHDEAGAAPQLLRQTETATLHRPI